MQVASISQFIAPSAIASIEPLANAAAPAQSFGNMVSQGLAQVNEQLQTSQADLQALATGEVQNLHQVMIRMEESRLSFQLMLQVRNRLLESYQDIMKMQI
ncbi:flagellar hook-basal body complex protein FliE [Undibacterium umbellatum]|uniref:Flagellar hook-basal body complex protein FliE n=1 Tax=Undibacterium umbellatum TaxID=2762300 RepID=A0ABR6ZHA9_9BURK|nr:flagellar hook-basal body complex protein FliE [Undibacterium umbellatum]MBC3911127.1 flagellar hook-basal body complex protein FliE [Undibacterium umbellatum]